MNLEGLPAKDLYAISALLRAAYMEAVRLQHGWMGPLAEVQALANRYEEIADDLEGEA